MTKKKMCPWYKRAACSVDHTEYNYDKYKYVRHDCPKNVNDKCEIVEKDITIKVFTHPDIVRTTNPMFWGTFRKSATYSLPATLHIKASDYKKLKRDK